MSSSSTFKLASTPWMASGAGSIEVREPVRTTRISRPQGLSQVQLSLPLGPVGALPTPRQHRLRTG